MPEVPREHIGKHVHTRLRRRIQLYLGISILIVLAILYRILVDGGGFLYPLVALVVGIAAGLLFSRMYSVSWDTKAEQVVSRIDMYGAIVLAVYVVFELTGEQLIRERYTGPEVWTIILALAGGAVLGRGLAIGRRMMRVLRENIF